MSQTAVFVQGSTLRHIVSNSMMGAVGLMTLFVVDLADLYFLSLLGEVELAAAVGYAGAILFFTTSMCIGIAIAMAALVARALGAEEVARAKRYTVHGGLLAVLLTTPAAVTLWLFLPELVQAVGATGRAHELAVVYLRIIVPSMPILALAMAAGGVLRASGAAKLAMISTVAGGIVNAVLDPFFIFTLEMGVAGAATASVLARVTVLGVGLYGVWAVKGMFGRFDSKNLLRDSQRFLSTALPAIATNLATPLGNLIVMRQLAGFGDDAVAGYAIIGRIIPVAFGILFALSGAIGPIAGQNYGAGRMDRVRRCLIEAALFAGLVVIASGSILLLTADMIALAFDASTQAKDLLVFFTQFVSWLYVFAGLQFVANAAFNNLGRPLWSTGYNWARATVGTLPFVYLGGLWGGAEGVLLGHGLGGVFMGTLAFMAALRLTSSPQAGLPGPPLWRRKLFNTPLPPQSNVFGWVPSAQAWLDKRRMEK